ncbi:MAG: dihydrodipicolinate synthase family protein [Thermoplasmataceae archaeon]
MDKLKLICPMITPIDDSREPSREFYKILIEDLKKMGVTSIFPLGSTGLFSLLNMDTKKKYLNIVAEESDGMEIFVGIGSQNTDEALELGKYAYDLGFKNMVLQPTYYLKAEQPWIVKHFSELTSNIDANFIIYNIPQLTGVSIDPASIIAIMESSQEKIKGIKESSGNIRYFNDLLLEFGSKTPIYQGQDDLLLQSLIMGGHGGVCGSTNISSITTQIINAYSSRNFEVAERAQKNLNFIFKILNSYPFPSVYYLLFYKKHKLKGRIPYPITSMGKIPDSFVAESLDSIARLDQMSY